VIVIAKQDFQIRQQNTEQKRICVFVIYFSLLLFSALIHTFLTKRRRRRRTCADRTV